MYDSIDINDDDRRNGFVLFSCRQHGGIAATFPSSSVRCGCGDPATPTFAPRNINDGILSTQIPASEQLNRRPQELRSPIRA
jgi:hypothetical protein